MRLTGMRFKTMILKKFVNAALAATALTFGVSGAQAQYSIAPPVAGGSVFVMPYYAPAFVVTPSISFGAPYFYQSQGYGIDNFGFGNFGNTNFYGFGYPNYGYY